MEVFENRQAASAHASSLISSTLSTWLDDHNRASLVVSGGGTPLSCLRMLSTNSLPWRRIDVTLTDERDIPPEHPDSNQKMVRENLLVANAAEGRFVRLEKGEIEPIQPFACNLVGMGDDGHFASIFPDSPQLAEAVSSAYSVEINSDC